MPHDSMYIRSFLDFVGFSRRSIKNFAKTATPLTDLTATTTVPFLNKLPKAAIVAFEALKKALVSVPIVSIANPVPVPGSLSLFGTSGSTGLHMHPMRCLGLS